MGDDAVTRFLDEVARDSALGKEYAQAIASAFESVVGPAIVAVAARRGYEFDFAALRRHLEERDIELDDSDLDAAAGGQWGSRYHLSWLASPWVLGGVVAAAIAIPLSIGDDDDMAS